MVEKLVPVPVAGLPPVAVQANVYGVVPPVADAVHETGEPAVPDDGQLIVTANGSAAMVTVADLVSVFAGVEESVPVTDIVSVPFVEYVVEKLVPVPEEGVPPVAIHANVYGAVPPVAETVQSTAVPTVPVLGHVMVTTKVGGEMAIDADIVDD